MARPNAEVPSGLFDLARNLLGPSLGDLAGQVASRVAESVLPPCVVCGERAIPLPCLRCGKLVCGDHGYFRLGQRTLRLDAICRACVVSQLQAEAPGETEGLSPHELLGVAENATAEQIRRAFAAKARKCHPDYYPGIEAKDREYRRLVTAREAALDALAG